MSDEKQDIVEHFRRFARERKSIRGVDPNEITGMHVGHEREIILTVADLEAAAAEIERLRERVETLEHDAWDAGIEGRGEDR